eukprot:CAMPEP_0201666162 /NCGR_PEP_ID=MMETSP0494-20130426/7089_1 /ASSEMBLY_ACC=CAM_ASM_000839 /TAXON_ID=420259 /ORGANISM="Thalassiosira gravida, Strain GMp14c1" /LENGTH=130 /DNA_ID=CAMNT_0048145263 /DNA_START=129 /DNA_END=518 /DNA_ORIENTATION=+
MSYKKPSEIEIKAELDKKIQEETRSDDIKANEFMQGNNSSKQQRAERIPTGFSQRASTVKAGWDARVKEETKADDIKAREFSNTTGWSKKRAEDVPSLAEKPSQVKSSIEANVEKESESDDAKSRIYLKK